MDDKQYNLADTIIKSLGFGGVVVSLFIGGWQFNKNIEKEYKKPLWEAQLKLCSETVKITSLLARSEKDGKVDQKQVDALFKTFYGEAPLLLSQETMNSLGEMGRLAYQCNNPTNKKTSRCKGPIFNGLSLNFSRSCRDMIIKSSGLPIDKLNSDFKQLES
ncbi:hypothetical protein Q4601_06935 [Shewanella sp. 1_MG-2023]|uniref:hypothetical protein n=1 Tax=unclassified Shewanella TaxID=196818 RepID=UPI0026E2DA55|nr:MULTISPECIES: hypothetical protein [unclassified Shewanella]MDO6612278.1 hypothetical protein [Shewanella sp. 7_MG-2023]MDO6772132.1 hypothetical protein [Shewanella sp. 2_MG-2023]MDO6794038.1 hypothetical protein [Shewanella sp. 1_MG-2023]